ncbi:MAG: hypothetical protein ACJAWM_001850 [Sulfitobacter sp.]|jgi:hypothetical protein
MGQGDAPYLKIRRTGWFGFHFCCCLFVSSNKNEQQNLLKNE